MTQQQAEAKYPEAVLVEDVTMDLSKVLRRRLVEPAGVAVEEARVVWEDESL